MRQTLIALVCILFCGWFLMKFHMDTANDSETQAYVSALIASASNATVSTDVTGRYAALAPYVMWPFTVNLELVTGAYLIRGLVFALLTLSIAFCGLAYVWFRSLGIGWFTSLLGLVLLTTSAAFALQIRGWELDKLIEPILFLAAGLLAIHRRWLAFVLVAVLAAANSETGIFVAFVALLAPEPRPRWPFWTALVMSVLIVAGILRLAPPPPIALWIDASPDQLVNIAGGLCLLPLLALASWRAISPGMRWLVYAIVPAWVIFVIIATHRLDQGAAFLAPLALVWLPVSLLALEQVIRAQPSLAARGPEAPSAR